MKNQSFFLCMILVMISYSLQANISLPSVFSNHMVLQRNSEITVWGWGKPYEKISIIPSWDTVVVYTETNNQANWSATLKTPDAGGPYTITFHGFNTVVLEDVLIGEVWLCSGQSNMEWSARLGIDDAQEAVVEAEYPNIRFFSVVHRSATNPNYDIDGSWAACSPETMIDFSAIGYFFARSLYEELHIPIGIVNASWGGTPAEVWVPEQKIMNKPVLRESARKIPEMGWAPREPGRVYNAMIAPITRFSIAGVLWYQGETNVANPETYHELFETLIMSWREEWHSALPFYFAQIAPFTYNESPTCAAEIRDAQRRTLRLPQTGMVVTSDITTDLKNIHPTNKYDVGKRFADIALHKVYGKTELPVFGPLYAKHTISSNRVVVYFDHAEGLHSTQKKIEGFELAGADGVFYPATAHIEKETIIVESTKVAKPVYVRFAWSNTAQPEIFNAHGLPISCFTSQ
ncbi:MAG: sialate O-acetylesterase [Bacteroidales bacterium]|jgi:sialate O-acetylesterase|nr:sialate O-acetylesterase [Bacteroidales bacterium]